MDDKEQLKVEERGADVRTFLIADVRGYTRFTQEQGDEAAGALAAKFAKIADAAVTDLGGQLLELRGDEALAVFTSARGALRAAVELQARLRTPTESGPPLALGVGIGLDAGEAVPIEGGYRGGALNLAARLCAIAEPGQILASETVVSLARRVDGLRFVTRRAVRLKGLPEPVRMVEIAPERPLPPLPQAPSKKPRSARPGFRALLAAAVVAAALGAVAFNRFAGPEGLRRVPPNSVGIIDASSGAIASRLPLQGRPGGVAVGAGSVWVTDEVAGTLLRVDPVEQIVVDTIPVGDAPAGVAVGEGAVWIANSDGNTVSQFNPESGTVVATIPVGNGPIFVAVGAGAVWVANATDGTIARIDPARSRTVATVALPQPPSGLAAKGQEVWATSAQGGLVSKVDPATNTVSQTLLVGNGPTGIALGAGAVWVSNGPDKTVSRVDESGEITKINVSGAPESLAFEGGKLWVASSLSGTVSEIDVAEATVVRTIDVGSDPRGLALEGGRVWMATLGAANAHRGGTLRVVLEGGPADTFDSIDPGVTFRAQSWKLLALTHDGLVAFRRVGGPAGATLVPDLATGIPAAQDDGKTYTFQLRDGIMYSTGDLVKAQDFRSAIERQFEFGTGMAAAGLNLVESQGCGRGSQSCDLSQSIVTDDASGTVNFHLAQADPEFLYKLALPWGAPVPTDSPRPSYPGRPIPGTGAYMIESYEPDRRIVLIRNPHFKEWSADAQPVGFPDSIVWRFGFSPAGQTTAVQQGDADVMLDDPPPERIHQIVTRFPTQAHPYVSAGVYFMFLNTRIPPFDDARVRRALNLALDRAAIVKAWGGKQLAQPTCQVLPPGLPGYRPYCPFTKHASSSSTWSGPAVGRARELVRSSGTAGQEVTVHALKADPLQFAGARRVAATLGHLGYRVHVKAIGDFNEYYSLVGKGATQAQIGNQGWFADYPIASNFFPLLLSCDSYQPRAELNLNAAGFCDRRIDGFIDRATAAQASAPSTAAQLWQRVDRAVVDAAPWLPLINERGIDLLSERVGNYQRSPQLGVLLDQLWVE
ncbi:MAG: ABC transporter substrate-binding protein [Actinomycetota bacterium]